MKKILCLFFVLLLSGCSDAERVDIKPIVRNISFTAEMTFYNEYYELAVDISKNGDTSVTVIHPSELDGLEFKIKDKKVTASLEGITLEVNNHNKTLVDFLYKPFESENQTVYNNDEKFFIRGKCDGGEYTMYITEAGIPLSVCDNADRYEIIIKDFKIK